MSYVNLCFTYLLTYFLIGLWPGRSVTEALRCADDERSQWDRRSEISQQTHDVLQSDVWAVPSRLLGKLQIITNHTGRWSSRDGDALGPRQQPPGRSKEGRTKWWYFVQSAGFPCILESSGFFLDFPGPLKSWKISLVLESPGNERYWKMKILDSWWIYWGFKINNM